MLTLLVVQAMAQSPEAAQPAAAGDLPTPQADLQAPAPEAAQAPLPIAGVVAAGEALERADARTENALAEEALAEDALAKDALAEDALAEDALEAGTAPAPTRRVTRRKSATERWIRAKVPDHLEAPGPLRIEWWQWIAMPVILLLSAFFGQIARRLTSRTFGKLVRATQGAWDDALLARSKRPLDLVWGMGCTSILSSFLYLREPAGPWVSEGLHVGLLLTVLWFATRAADIAGDAAILRAKAAGNIGTASVLPLIVRASKIGLVALGLISVLSTMGYPVSSLLAGLGIGGLALALAAQKTAENVFGSVSISIDQPFRVGDLVKIDELIGVVERIGLRSTSIRTAERTLITWPNGKLADLRVENYAARDRLRFSSTFALALDTPRANLEAAVAAIEARLAAEPSVWPSDATARVTRVTPTAIEVEVAAWLLATPDAFTLVKQSLILDILATLAATGVHLARPPEPLRV